MDRSKNIIGQKFGRLTVVERAINDKYGNAMWKCVCECGKQCTVRGGGLRSGNVLSCGCLQKERAKAGTKKLIKDLVGQTFGELTVIKKSGHKGKNITWECKCNCGNLCIVSGGHLRSGHTKSCGCIRAETLKKMSTKHGKYHNRLHDTWGNMKKRCYNPKYYEFDDYGGRGITVCDEWKNDFQVFYDWAMSHGYRDDLTIERSDVDGSYSPDNCKWATKKEQANNKRNNIKITYKGKTQNLKQLTDELGLNYKKIWKRINVFGWTIEKALETP